MNYNSAYYFRLQTMFSAGVPASFAAAAASLLIIVSRRPDAFFNPQFYGEDGVVWYAQAYQRGLIALLTPELGYYGTISRLTAAAAQFIPFGYVPAAFNLCAVAVKIITVQYFLSSRFAAIAPDFRFRLLAAFIYLVLPNSFEIEANLTNAQWHLALLGFLVVVAGDAPNKLWKAFDWFFLSLSVLSGPFCFFLLPTALIRYGQRRQFTNLLIVAGGCLMQSFALLSNERLPKAILGASVGLGTKIIGGQIFIGSLLGVNNFSRLARQQIWQGKLSYFLCAVFIGLMIAMCWKATTELKLFTLYATLALAAALIFPAASRTEPQWNLLAQPFVCVRYWFLPAMCFFSLLIYAAAQRENRILKFSACGLLVLSFAGIWADWRHPAYRDYNFSFYAEEFQKAAPGTEIVIPTNPDWEMKLIKK